MTFADQFADIRSKLNPPRTTEEAIEFMTKLLSLYCLIGSVLDMDRHKLAENTSNAIKKFPLFEDSFNDN